MHLITIDDFSCTLFNSISLSQDDDYEQFNPYPIDQIIYHNIANALEIEFEDYSENNFSKNFHWISPSSAYYDRITDWIERPFLTMFPENGKVMLTLFLNVGHKESKYDLFIYYFEKLHFILLIEFLLHFVGLELFEWLHWKFHVTWSFYY